MGHVLGANMNVVLEKAYLSVKLVSIGILDANKHSILKDVDLSMEFVIGRKLGVNMLFSLKEKNLSILFEQKKLVRSDLQKVRFV